MCCSGSSFSLYGMLALGGAVHGGQSVGGAALCASHEVEGEEVEDNDEAEEENDDEAADGPTAEPLPETAREFVDAVLSRKSA